MTQKAHNSKDKPDLCSADLIPESGQSETEPNLREEKPKSFTQTEFEHLLAAEREQRLLAETLTEATLTLTAQTSPTAVLEEILRQVKQIVPHQKKAGIRLLSGDFLRVAHTQDELAFDSQDSTSQDQRLSDFPLDAEIIQPRQTRIIS